MILETARLILRPWQDSDRLPLAAILGDPTVRRFYPSLATPDEVNAQIDNAIARTAEFGFHLSAVESKSDGRLLGLLGLARLPDRTRAIIPGHPEVEIGWQLDKSCWGQGLAPEGARAWLDYGWNALELPQVIAYTAAINLPSRRVMEKLGMSHDPQSDFIHPFVPEASPLRPHVVYRIDRPA